MKKFMIFLMVFSFNLKAEEQEESEALRALRLSCEKHKVALGCYNYANLLLSQKKENSEAIFKLGCDLGHQDSCSKKTWDSISAAPAAEPITAPAQEIPAAEAPSESTASTAPEETSPMVEESHAPASEEASVAVEESPSVDEAPKAEESFAEDTELDLSAIE